MYILQKWNNFTFWNLVTYIYKVTNLFSCFINTFLSTPFSSWIFFMNLRFNHTYILWTRGIQRIIWAQKIQNNIRQVCFKKVKFLLKSQRNGKTNEQLVVHHISQKRIRFFQPIGTSLVCLFCYWPMEFVPCSTVYVPI